MMRAVANGVLRSMVTGLISPFEPARAPCQDFDACDVNQHVRSAIIRMCVLSHWGFFLRQSIRDRSIGQTGQVSKQNCCFTLQALDRHCVLGLN
jgi:hypothetical protein